MPIDTARVTYLLLRLKMDMRAISEPHGENAGEISLLLPRLMLNTSTPGFTRAARISRRRCLAGIAGR